MKKDLYTVFIFKSGERFYFKNNELHREAGFAIVSPLFLNKENLAVDEELYTKVFPKNARGDYFTFKFGDGTKKVLASPKSYMYASSYYLNGRVCSEQQFKEYHIQKLQEELQNQLSKNETAIKKLKL